MEAEESKSGSSHSSKPAVSPQERLDKFLAMYRDAYELTQTAQGLDKDGLSAPAWKAYENALQKIDAVVEFAHQGGFPDSKVAMVDDQTLKIRLTRKEMLERISDLQDVGRESDSYLEGPTGSGMHPSTSAYSALEASLQEIANEQAAAANPLPANAREVFNIPANVQIYFIGPHENVSAPTYPSFLRLVLMDHDEGALGVVSSAVPGFLQVGGWTYPLIPGQSPVFRSTEGLYIFPDLTVATQGSYVGLILPDDISQSTRAQFEDTLLQLVEAVKFPDVVQPSVSEPQQKPPRPPLPASLPTEKGMREGAQSPEVSPHSPVTSDERRLSTKIAEGLVSGAEAMSSGLIYGAAKTSTLIDKGASYLQSRMNPAKEKPNIKPEYRKGMKTAKSVTGKAVKVSGYVVSQVGHATVSLGKRLAPHLHKASTKLLSSTVATDEADASSKVDQVLEVTGGALYGFGTLYMGFEDAAKTLVSSLANNTVQIVRHRYGDDAGEFATDTAMTAGNAAMTAWNAKSLAPKSVAKKVAKDTGRMVVEQHQVRKQEGNLKSPEFENTSSSKPM